MIGCVNRSLCESLRSIECGVETVNQRLKEKIRAREAQICIIGLGYVGLPLAIACAHAGFSVIGIDNDQNKVDDINKGKTTNLDIDNDVLGTLITAGKIQAVSNFVHLNEMDVILVCVPTGLTKNFTPDLQHIQSVVTELSSKLRANQLICIESTVYPGTIEEIVIPALETSALRAEQDFYVCHSPERMDPGNEHFSTANIPKLVGGLGGGSLELGILFYSQIVPNVIPTSSLKVAELAKLHENSFRAVNIALVNELTLICDKVGVCVWDVLDAAFSKPFGIMPFYPGPGVGGHCIPVDPHYLEWKARELLSTTRLISAAGEINRNMPYFVREKIWRVCNVIHRVPSQSKILLVGMAYKKDTADYRESPALQLTELLLEDGVRVVYHDPFVPRVDTSSLHLTSAPLTKAEVEKADLVVITVDHSNIDYMWLVQTASKIVDTRDATRSIPNREKNVILL